MKKPSEEGSWLHACTEMKKPPGGGSSLCFAGSAPGSNGAKLSLHGLT
ncbi:hypothetical protein WG902_13890 [Ramlibacter sp. PS3R-8]